MGAALRTRASAAARARRPGPGPQQRAPRAVARRGERRPGLTPGRAPRDVELARRTFHALLAGGGDDETNDATKTEKTETSEEKKPRARFLSLERLSARVVALEREAAAADAGAGSGTAISGAASFDDLALFDEEGALLSEETNATNDATNDDDEDDATNDDDERERRVTSDASETTRDSAASPRDARLAARATRRKARAAREMLDDVFSFFGREVGQVDERVPPGGMRHRARAHADASANFVVSPEHARAVLPRAAAPGPGATPQADGRAGAQVPAAPPAVRESAGRLWTEDAFPRSHRRRGPRG